MVGTCSGKDYRKKPINERKQETGTCSKNKPGSELTQSCSGSVNNSSKENVVENVPYTDNKSIERLDTQTDLYDICDENVLILVYVKTLREIINNICNCFL